MLEKYPVFPEELTSLSSFISVVKRGNQVVYLNPEGQPLRGHGVGDLQAFWALVSEFYVFGHFKQVDVVRVFGVSAARVRGSVKTYLAHGMSGFFRRPKSNAINTKALSVKEQVRQIRLADAEILVELAKDRKARAEAVKDGRLRNFTDRWDEAVPV